MYANELKHSPAGDLMLPKYSLKSPLITARFVPTGKLIKLPFSTELSMDLWPGNIDLPFPGNATTYKLMIRLSMETFMVFKKNPNSFEVLYLLMV